MKIIAQNDYVIGKPYKSEEKNGLIIANRNYDNIVVVISRPYGIAVTLSIGDIIIYNKDKAIELNIDGVTYIAFKLEDMIAHIKEEE